MHIPGKLLHDFSTKVRADNLRDARGDDDFPTSRKLSSLCLGLWADNVHMDER